MATPGNVRKVFIGSSPGSGSTLLAQLLCAHPRACSLAESAIFSNSIAGDTAIDRLVGSSFGFNKASVGIKNGDTPEQLKALLNSEGLGGYAQFILERRPEVTAIIDKHPSMTPYMSYVPTWHPGTQLVYLHRHPMAIMNSIRKKMAKNPEWEPGKNWCVTLPEETLSLSKMERGALMIAMCLRGRQLAIEQGYNVVDIHYKYILNPETSVKVCELIWYLAGIPITPEVRPAIVEALVGELKGDREDAYKEELSEEQYAEYAGYLAKYGVTW